MQKVEIDKIIAVEGLLNQMQILNDFGLESVAIIESTKDKETEKEATNLFGLEDFGIVSLFNDLEVVKFRISDILQITQLWKCDNVYSITIILKQSVLRILYRIAPHMTVIG